MRILLADKHPTVRVGLTSIIGQTFPKVQFVQAANGREVRRLCSREQFDLLVMDNIGMPGCNGLEVLHDLKRQWPSMPIIILTSYPEDQYAIRCLRAGAAAFVSKMCSTELLVSVVLKVLGGGHYISPHVAETLAFPTPANEKRHELLSDREFEIMKRIASGSSLTEIAESLHISPKTVSTYRTRIMTKMGLRANAEVTRYALEQRLIA